jgi:hypothetical protein
MELLKLDDRLEEYVWKDVTFYYRKTVSSGDKFNLDMAGSFQNNGKVAFNPLEYCRTLVRLFVTGWKGVTENGKDVPYSYETLESRFPIDIKGEDVIMTLGFKIAEAVGLTDNVKTEKEIDQKNG